MTEIAFHFNAPDLAVYACRVTRKLLRRDRRVVIQAAPELLKHIDELLWNMSPHDFVAHCSAGDSAELWNASPVLLTVESIPTPHRDVLLNLHDEVPDNFGSFQELIEIVGVESGAHRDAARQRWKHYRARGYKLVQHDLARKEA